MAYTGYVGMAAFEASAERQLRAMRLRYFEAILRQECGFFDTMDPGTLASRLTEDLLVVRDGMGCKLSQLFQFASMFICGWGVGIAKGWKLALVVFSAFPGIAGAAYFMFTSLSTTAQNCKANLAWLGSA